MELIVICIGMAWRSFHLHLDHSQRCTCIGNLLFEVMSVNPYQTIDLQSRNKMRTMEVQ
jgi:hypothetical protein